MTADRRSATDTDHQARILRVLIHLQKKLDADLSLADLAGVAHYSPFHFHRVFRGLVGEGVAEHLRRLKLERAAFQLRFTDDQVIRIALHAGFEAHESFTRAFSAMFGEPPSAFRERRRLEYPSVPSNVHYEPAGEVGSFRPLTGDPSMQVAIEKLPARRVAFVRHVGPYANVGSAIQRLFQWAGPKGLLGPGMEFFGMCYDDPAVTPADKLRYDACLVVAPAVRPEGDIGVQDIPAGEFATTIHTGPYQTLNRAYEALCGPWLATSGRTLGQPPSIEFYLNDPRTTPPDNLMTKVCLRLA